MRMEISLLILVFCLGLVLGQEEITTDLGKIKGKSFKTRDGQTISGYLGIPYAKPPTGELRFKSPEPYTDKYDDDGLKADSDGNICPQLNDDGDVVGDEDCLFLNVYTPKEFSDDPLPVIVFFHGGGFTKGSGSSSDAGPEYLMDRKIILVTVNYRLGALGFLSTGDSEAPGNFGLKDQGQALKWVRDNIANFNGNADQVTLYGYGAGGVSSSLHAIFNSTKDLFKRYISQSGNSNCPWAFEEPPQAAQHSNDLGNLVSCPRGDSRALINCLRKTDVEKLVDSESIFDGSLLRARTWTPTAESGGIIGNGKNDGLYWTAELYKNNSLYEKMSRDERTYLKFFIDMLFNEDSDKYYTDTAEKFYFEDVGDRQSFIQAMTDFMSDINFKYPGLQQFNLIMDDYSPANAYYYEFDYRGSTSLTSKATGNNDDIGVTHCDVLKYFFPGVDLDETDEKMSNIMIDFWISFATTGIPTSEALPDPNIWSDYIQSQRGGLKIGANSDPMDTSMYLAMNTAMQMWAELVNYRA